MPPRVNKDHLLQISKGSAKAINQLRLGAEMTKSSGRTIDDLIGIACKDRYKFAQQTLKMARWANSAPTPQYRVVLARSYYAMYHAARAVVYVVEGGDDHEAHQSLPNHIPKDFPDRGRWENEIKNARLERNKADYDPYPKTDRAFAMTARTALQIAEEFLPLARSYLAKKGFPI